MKNDNIIHKITEVCEYLSENLKPLILKYNILYLYDAKYGVNKQYLKLKLFYPLKEETKLILELSSPFHFNFEEDLLRFIEDYFLKKEELFFVDKDKICKEIENIIFRNEIAEFHYSTALIEYLSFVKSKIWPARIQYDLILKNDVERSSVLSFNFKYKILYPSSNNDIILDEGSNLLDRKILIKDRNSKGDDSLIPYAVSLSLRDCNFFHVKAPNLTKEAFDMLKDKYGIDIFGKI